MYPQQENQIGWTVGNNNAANFPTENPPIYTETAAPLPPNPITGQQTVYIPEPTVCTPMIQVVDQNAINSVVYVDTTEPEEDDCCNKNNCIAGIVVALIVAAVIATVLYFTLRHNATSTHVVVRPIAPVVVGPIPPVVVRPIPPVVVRPIIPIVVKPGRPRRPRDVSIENTETNIDNTQGSSDQQFNFTNFILNAIHSLNTTIATTIYN